MLSLQRAGTILRPSAQHDSTRRKTRRACGRKGVTKDATTKKFLGSNTLLCRHCHPDNFRGRLRQSAAGPPGPGAGRFDLDQLRSAEAQGAAGKGDPVEILDLWVNQL